MKNNWGKGYGTEAVTAIVKKYALAIIEKGHTLKGKPLEKIVATARIDNLASVKILENLGMHLIGNSNKYGALRYHFFIDANEL